MIFLAQDINLSTPPPGLPSWLACAAFVVLVAERTQAFWKRSQPMPPMEAQLVGLEQRIMKRFNEQDKEWAEKLGELRDHIDTEKVRLHERIDAHGKELYRLQGFVYGKHAHGGPPEER